MATECSALLSGNGDTATTREKEVRGRPTIRVSRPQILKPHSRPTAASADSAARCVKLALSCIGR
jgi:hypothetical protein